ncbi:hypothetical protein H5410_060281 [Solanum commersonii]|uniref:Uncharacterized protein n=1 Tax=Solanum commersonii TaxID=4109 RepID=A0A9J5W4N0_SOLCO|nr:hypothetical protein H5410_060281 [Solanum commersonii]
MPQAKLRKHQGKSAIASRRGPGWGELCESYAENDIGKSEYRVVCEVVLENPSEGNDSVVREFYANWKPDARSYFVIMRGVEVPQTPGSLNQILGTTYAPSDVLTWINISPLYQQI